MRPNIAFRAGCVHAAILAISLLTGGCPTADQMTTLPSDIVGVSSTGQQIYNYTCSDCHRAQSLASVSSRITNNMGSANRAMSGITLTDQDIADLRAFFATQ